MVKTKYLSLDSQGNCDVIDITRDTQALVAEMKLVNGIITIFCPSATSALTTIEYESGCVKDIQSLLDRIINPKEHYYHNLRWGDGNGHSHLRAALLQPDLTVPIVEGKLTLGTWQQIIFIDFDTRPRSRQLVLQGIGE
jgi:secondary thiamine-phosphate synthase enzyme